MPNRPADLRRHYRLHLQLGAAMALLVVLVAFTVPTPPPAEMLVLEEPPPEITVIDPVPPTATPPPPPPPAPPPPVEVPDETEIEALAVETFDIEAFDPAPPTGPREIAGPPPVPPRERAAPPPIEDVPHDENQIIEVVEIEPELIGGLEGLQSRVTYPEAARRVGAEGTVYVGFVVERDGSVSNAEVLRSPNALLADAAMVAVRESRFTPGVQQGLTVRVRYTVPVRFVLR